MFVKRAPASGDAKEAKPLLAGTVPLYSGLEIDNPAEKSAKDVVVDNTSNDHSLDPHESGGHKSSAKRAKISVFSLFRYASKGERALFAVGALIAAFAGIAYPPCNAVLLGRMVNVNFNYDHKSQKFVDEFFFFRMAALRVTARLRRLLLAAIVRQDAHWCDRHDAGGIINLLGATIDRVTLGICEKLGQFVQAVFMCVSAQAVAFYYSWRIALVTLPFTPVTIALFVLLTKSTRRAGQLEAAMMKRAMTVVEESLSAVNTVAACNGQKDMVRKYEERVQPGVWYGFRSASWNGLVEGSFFAMIFIVIASAIYYGTVLLTEGKLDEVGDIFTVFQSILLGGYQIGLLTPQFLNFLHAAEAAAAVYEVIERTPMVDAMSKDGETLKNIEGNIEFKDVLFSYPARPNQPILRGVSYKIKKGQTVALSTSIGLLTRLYTATGGVVTIDGIDIRKLNAGWLRGVVGVVQQEPVLFHGTIAENLRLGRPGATDEELQTAAKTANAYDFIMKLDKGFETRLGKGGVQLSGGQKQRLVIARTLLRDPKILLLDEATSALDTQSELLVQAALERTSKGRTTIVIAHRLSTVRNADCIIVLEKGLVKEQGTHNELLARNGLYAGMVAMQQVQSKESDEDEDKNKNKKKPESSVYSMGASCREEIEAQKPKVMHGGQLITEFVRVSGCAYFSIFMLGCMIMLARGADIPIFLFIFRGIYKAFQGTDILGDMQTALFQQIMIAGGVFITSTIGLSILGYGGELCLLRVRVAVLRALLYRRSAYFDREGNAPALLITQLDQLPPAMKAFLDARFGKLLHNLVSCFANLALSFYFCWMVASLGLGIFLVVFAFQTSLNVVVAKRKKAAEKDETPSEHAVEVIENIRTIQILTAEQHFLERYNVLLTKELRANVINSVIQGMYFGLMQQGLVSITFAGAFGLGIGLIRDGKFEDTDVFLSATAIALMMFALGNAVPQIPDIVKGREAGPLLFRHVREARLDEAKQPMNMESIQEIQGNVVFENVWFAYRANEKSVLRGLNFTAKAGQTVALVGPSGSGKSTTVALIEQFYSPERGTIKIDGRDLKSYDLTELRERIALVGQEPRLFSGTVLQNLKLGSPNASQEDIVNACRIANAETFIKTLPDGYDTDIGERGGRLSGGQKQRLAIARALVKNPRILLLDEATSALDSHSEKAVQQALEKARAGRTCITIAHRLSSIQNSDVIYYLEAGRTREHGTHTELMAKRHKYYRLVQNAKLHPTQ